MENLGDDVTLGQCPFNIQFSIKLKEIMLFQLQVGPSNPFKTQQQAAKKNMLAGYVEPAHFNAFQFENQRRTFTSYGKLKASTNLKTGTEGVCKTESVNIHVFSCADLECRSKKSLPNK